MLMSGLWKLAAMAGVIGVGVVAAFQAREGMDNKSVSSQVTADGDTATEPNGDAIDVIANAKPSSDPVDDPDRSDPNDTDPFGKPSFGVEGLSSKSPAAGEQAVQPVLTTPGDSSAIESDPFPTDSPANSSATATATAKDKATANAKARPGPGIDFRGDSTGPTLIEPVAETNAVRTAGLDEAPPARLPDDLEALEAEVLNAAARSTARRTAAASDTSEGQTPVTVEIKPFVRQTSQEVNSSRDAEADLFRQGDTVDSADPFGGAASPKDEGAMFKSGDRASTPPNSGTPNTSEPSSPKGSGPASDETDSFPDAAPFAAEPTVKPSFPKAPPQVPSELPDSEPTKSFAPESEPDPFADTAPRKAPSPVSDPELGKPFDAKSDAANPLPTVTPEPDLSSPFSAEPPGTPKPTPAELPEMNPRRGNTVPRLPTEIPDPRDDLEGSFPAAPPARTLDPETKPAPETRPLPDRNTVPVRRPADDQPKSLENDLFGDGTVSPTSPRGLQQPRLTIEKVAPQQATLGEAMVYSIIIKNIGGVDAQRIVVEDQIPKGTEMTGSAPRADIIDKTLFWKIGTLKPNEEKKISVRVIPRQEGPVGSVARVSFSTEVAAEIQVDAPQLSFNVKAPRQARMGETIELTFLLKNTGNVAATNVSVRDLVPAGLKHDASADIECPIGRLAPNETREIVLTVTAVKPGLAKNMAILSGDGGISQELESAIEIVGEQLVLTRSGQTRIYADRPTVFTNNIKNDGNAEVPQVRIAETLPAEMEFVEASQGGRFDPVQRAIYWDLGKLPPGAETAVSSKLVARSPGLVHSKVTATGPAGASAVVTSDVDVVGRPELQIETVSRTGVVAVGDRLTSKIQLKNHGSASATNVGLSIHLPRELKLIEVRGGQYKLRDNLITFDSVQSISPDEATSFEVVMEAVAEAEAQMNLEISADHLSKPARRSETVQIAAEIQ